MTTLCVGTGATTGMVHVPRGVQELSERLRTATDELAGRIGRPPIVAELARHLGVGEEAVLDARAAPAAHSPPFAGRADLRGLPARHARRPRQRRRRLTSVAS